MNTGLGRRMLLILAGAACLGVGAYVSANVPLRPAPPAAPVIATVDLPAVMEGLKEREDKEKLLTARIEEYRSKLKALEEEIKNDKGKIEAMPDTAPKIDAAKALREKIFRAEFEAKYLQQLVGELRGEMLRDLYTRINDGIKTLSRQEGYMLVVAADDKVPVASGDPDNVLRSIALKRMLYVDPAMDVTQSVVQLLNNQYAATGGASPAPTPPKRKP